MTRKQVLQWLVRLVAGALIFWLAYDRQNHRVNWLLFVTGCCFYVLGALIHDGWWRGGKARP